METPPVWWGGAAVFNLSNNMRMMHERKTVWLFLSFLEELKMWWVLRVLTQDKEGVYRFWIWRIWIQSCHVQSAPCGDASETGWNLQILCFWATSQTWGLNPEANYMLHVRVQQLEAPRLTRNHKTPPWWVSQLIGLCMRYLNEISHSLDKLFNLIRNIYSSPGRASPSDASHDRARSAWTKVIIGGVSALTVSWGDPGPLQRTQMRFVSHAELFRPQQQEKLHRNHQA